MAGIRRRGRTEDSTTVVAKGNGNGSADGAAHGNANGNGAGNGNAAAPAPAPALPTHVANGGGTRTWTLIGELLVKHEFVTPDELERALLEQANQNGNSKRLGSLLIDLGALEERHLTLALADQAGIALVDLRRERPDPAALACLPEAVARDLLAFPLRFVEDGIEIVVCDPNRADLKAQLEQATNNHVRLLLAPPSEVRRTIDQS